MDGTSSENASLAGTFGHGSPRNFGWRESLYGEIVVAPRELRAEVNTG